MLDSEQETRKDYPLRDITLDITLLCLILNKNRLRTDLIYYSQALGSQDTLILLTEHTFFQLFHMHDMY